MVSRSYLRTLLLEFDSKFRIAFKANDTADFRQIKQSKHFIHDFKYQSGIIKWQALSNTGLGQAVFADFFVVHTMKITFLIN